MCYCLVGDLSQEFCSLKKPGGFECFSRSGKLQVALRKIIFRLLIGNECAHAHEYHIMLHITYYGPLVVRELDFILSDISSGVASPKKVGDPNNFFCW